MKAVVQNGFGDTSVLQLVTDHPIPLRKAGEVLVKVAAAGLNPLDIKIRKGEAPHFLIAKDNIPGVDFAGLVQEADEGSKFKPGDRVFAFDDGLAMRNPAGTLAEYLSVREAKLGVVPEGLALEAAAAVATVSLTAWQAVEQASIQEGHRVLVHGGAGGVGSFAVQFAASKGAYVVATASAKNQELVKQLGASAVVDYRSQDFVELYRGEPFDAVVDVIGGPNTPKSLAVLKPRGRYVLLLTDFSPWTMLAIAKGIVFSKLGWGPWWHPIACHSDGSQLSAIASLLAEGKLKANVGKAFPMEQFREAEDALEKGTGGRVVVKVP